MQSLIRIMLHNMSNKNEELCSKLNIWKFSTISRNCNFKTLKFIFNCPKGFQWTDALKSRNRINEKNSVSQVLSVIIPDKSCAEIRHYLQMS